MVHSETRFPLHGNIRKPPACEPLKVYRSGGFAWTTSESKQTAGKVKYPVVWIPKVQKKVLWASGESILGH
jgi:hypothetical protein